jgi:4-amino-4-deoxy-L-arabinose transferase-like glycosyltransferase
MAVPVPVPPPPPWSRRLQVWRSPSGQPAWARPSLLVVTASAAFAYSWQVGSTIELFYAAATRSMTESWHNFLFGAFDPAGTVTVDKLPGALWLQALSARVFGFHVWSLMLPQAVEGALTVLVLYHAVRRLAGPIAGLAASVVLAASPATMTLDRGNIPDTLMILLLVLAADSTVTAIQTGRARGMAMVGVWVGLAFQAKMLEAWLVLPALGLAYVVAARASTAARARGLVVLGATAVVISLAYMAFVTITPASQRPSVDGSTSNSIFQQVFDYNGYSRVGQASPNQLLGRTLGTPLFSQAEPPPAWNRLLTRSYGRDTGWLLPAAVIAASSVIVARRRRPRTDLMRAGALLWGTWLLVLAVVFTISTTMNSYYAGALSPAVAGLLGIGGALAWDRRREARVAVITAGTVLITVGYAAWLLPTGGTGFPAGLAAAAIVCGLAAVLALAWSAVRGRRGSDSPHAGVLAAVLAGAALLLVPAVASASAVAEGLGPFDTPFQPTATTTFLRHVFAPQPTPPGLADIESVRRAAPYLMAAQTSAVASPFIYATGEEVLPLGGYTGTIPVPSAAATRAMIAAGKFHLALVAKPGATAASRYITGHCLHVAPRRSTSSVTPTLKIYYCLRSDG